MEPLLNSSDVKFNSTDLKMKYYLFILLRVRKIIMAIKVYKMYCLMKDSMEVCDIIL